MDRAFVVQSFTGFEWILGHSKSLCLEGLIDILEFLVKKLWQK